MKLPKHTSRAAAKRILTFLFVLIVGYVIFIWITQPSLFQTPAPTDEPIPRSQNIDPPTPVVVKIPGSSPFVALKDDYRQPASLWRLVNKDNAIPLNFTPTDLTLASVATRSDKSIEERSVRSDINAPLEQLFAAAAAHDHELLIGSAYRSSLLQKTYFDHYALVAGSEAANRYSAHPGESEHQTGLSVDISSVSLNCYLEECFSKTPEGQWLAANAHRYGFVLRYPKGKEAITGYQFEPWHFRYVGVNLATVLHRTGLTLDQAWPYLMEARAALKKNGTI